jgi:hypothetical protein
MPRLTEEQEHEAACLYRGGLSLRRAGAELGVASPTILRALRKLGVKRRAKGGHSGENASRWKGGRYTVNGYVLVKRGAHPRANCRGYVMEHRLVMEDHLGRYLEPGEVVHHRNGDGSDNRLENLRLYGNTGDHSRQHADERRGGADRYLYSRSDYPRAARPRVCDCCGEGIAKGEVYEYTRWRPSGGAWENETLCLECCASDPARRYGGYGTARVARFEVRR